MKAIRGVPALDLTIHLPRSYLRIERAQLRPIERSAVQSWQPETVPLTVATGFHRSKRRRILASLSEAGGDDVDFENAETLGQLVSIRLLQICGHVGEECEFGRADWRCLGARQYYVGQL